MWVADFIGFGFGGRGGSWHGQGMEEVVADTSEQFGDVGDPIILSRRLDIGAGFPVP